MVVTVEDGSRSGGVGSRLSQALRDAGVDVPARDVGIPPQFLAHGSVAQVKADIGLTAQDVARRVVEWVSGLDAAPDHAVGPAEPAEP
jgi:1-deoxy-D-xylulose-5-phosphate synthase